MEEIKFRAVLPAIQSAVKIDGGGNGARIQLDVPEVNKMEVFKLASMTGCVLEISVKAAENTN